MQVLFTFGLVLAVYLSLAVLPKGRSAVIGLVFAGCLVMLGFLVVPSAGPLLTLALVGAGMAALAQALRPLFAARMYFALLGLFPLLVLAALMFSIGD